MSDEENVQTAGQPVADAHRMTTGSTASRPTMAMIARSAGVSAMTVSRALSGHPHVSDPVRARVRDIAVDVGYRPNLIARSLRTQQSRAVGLAITDVSNPFNALMIDGADGVLGAAGYFLVTATSAAELGRDVNLVDLLEERRVDGVLWTVVDEKDVAVAKVLSARRVPIVLMNRRVEGSRADSVTADHFSAIRKAMIDLAEHGHRRIAIITGPLHQWPGRERLRGFQMAVQDAALDRDPDLMLESAPDAASGYQAAQRMLDLSAPPTALIAGGNRVALGALRFLTRAGVVIPDQLSVVVGSGSEYLEFTIPQIANILPPMRAIGETAARQLLTRIGGGGPVEPQQLSLPCEYSPGSSIGPPRRI